jgi:hypothetical protein
MVIYKIQNKINGKIYVGQTTKQITDRFLSHSKNDSVIGYAIRKYGLQSFDICIIDMAEDKQSLNEKEIYWIDQLGSLVPNGYNVSVGGFGGNLGDIVNKKIREIMNTPEVKEKVSKGLKKAFENPELRAKISKANKGRKQSKETIDKKIASTTGLKRSEETRQRMRHPHKKMKDSSMTGKYERTEEHKKNTGISSKGRKNPKLSEINRLRTGQKQSEETVNKRRNSLIKYYKNKKGEI